MEILKLSGGGGELTVAVLLLQATQGVCCSPSASPVCPSCCSTSSIRLPSTASWQGTPSPLTSTVSRPTAFMVKALSLKSVRFVVYVKIKATQRSKINKERARIDLTSVFVLCKLFQRHTRGHLYVFGNRLIKLQSILSIQFFILVEL